MSVLCNRTAGPARLGLLMAMAMLVSSQAGNAATLSPAVKQACGAELRSLCLRPWRLTPDAIAQCVEDNRLKLSPPCQGFWETARLCRMEMKNVCGGLSPLTIKRCLAQSGAEFSATCRETMNLK